MAITFRCECGKELRAREELAGKKARCAQCGAVFRIPEPQVVVAPALFDDVVPADADADADDGNPYGLMEPEPRAVAPAPVASTYHSTPGDGAKPTRFRPAGGSPAAAGQVREARPQAKKPQAQPRSRPRQGSATILEYSYLLLALTLIPLVFSLLGAKDADNIEERFAETIAAAAPEDRARIDAELARDSIDLEQALGVMPGHRLTGAHLARDTAVHWIYAAIATTGFLLWLSLCFSVERANPVHLLGVGIFTSTVGILFLLAVQFCAMIRIGRIRGGGVVMILFLIMMFIGWSYESANDPETGFLLSAFGFTFGVGLCEEFTKAIPMFFWFRRYSEVGWRGACVWGLASGIGFGIAEGVMYSSRYYNGISGGEIYLVRFVSCVALHAMWAGSVGIAIARRVDEYQEIDDAAGFGLFAVKVMAVPMVLHGFYDTLLKKDMNGWALVVALLSFAWLAWHIEFARRERPAGGRPKVARSVMAYG